VSRHRFVQKAPLFHAALPAAIELEPEDQPQEEPPPLAIPADWQLGALLNVRNGGEHYVVTLYPEEFDPRHPERAIRFGNPATCQEFVSKWYARQHFDPRAY
jgi:hypothetical protein